MISAIKENWVELRPGRNYYVLRSSAESSITLFFIHGAGGRTEQWREQIKFFQNKFNLVAFDFLGLGKSDKPKPTSSNPDIYSFAEFSKDLQIIFNHYHTKENIILGHSYGGTIASNLALHNPDTIQKLVLSSPMPLLPKSKLSKLFDLPPFVLNLLQPYLTKLFMRLAYHANSDPELVAYETAAANRNPMYVIKAVAKAIQEIPPLNLKKILQPTLILLSKEDDVVPAQKSLEYYQQLPHVEFKYISNAKHMSILEQPDSVNQTIATFIAS